MRTLRGLSALALTCLCFCSESFACAVCFGDPKSPLTHGALAGVLFLGAVILMVLGSIAGVTFFWIRRARLLQVQAAIRGEKPEVY